MIGVANHRGCAKLGRSTLYPLAMQGYTNGAHFQDEAQLEEDFLLNRLEAHIVFYFVRCKYNLRCN